MPPGAKEAPRCLIVDDHPVIRAGIRVVLEKAFAGSAISDVASLDDAAEAFSDQSPDVVIIDPWRTGVDLGALSAGCKATTGRRSYLHLRWRRPAPERGAQGRVKGYVRKRTLPRRT